MPSAWPSTPGRAGRQRERRSRSWRWSLQNEGCATWRRCPCPETNSEGECPRAVRGPDVEYMLTRFSEPNELFGPIDIARLREGVVATVTTGMLPEAELIFLDEIFNANSAILNNLLTVLNERTYRRGAETHSLPLLSLFSASNHLPEDDALKALFDRFLLRCPLDNLRREVMPQLLTAGWELE